MDFEFKENQKVCRHVKVSFIDVLKCVDNLDLLTETRFQDFRKNKVIYKFQEFSKFYKEHLKNKGHEESENLLKKTLFLLEDLMIKNTSLLVFEKKHPNDKLLRENNFQHKALIEEFCLSY